jgi:hypothetical protein
MIFDTGTLLQGIVSLPGFVSLGYLIWKKFTGKVEILYSYGKFTASKSTEGNLSDIVCDVSIGIANRKNTNVSLTDVIGTLRYNNSRYKANNLNLRKVFSLEPTSMTPNAPLNISPNETVQVSLTFSFPKVHLPSIDRAGVAHFMGFLEGIPTAIIDENETQRNWDNNPINFLVSIHIDGKEVKKDIALLIPEMQDESRKSGTFSVVDVAKIERDFLK